MPEEPGHPRGSALPRGFLQGQSSAITCCQHLYLGCDRFILIDARSVLGLHSASCRILALESHQHPLLPCSAAWGKALPHSAQPGTYHVPASPSPQASDFCPGMRFRQVQPTSSCMPIQGAREKLRSSIFDRVNACNMLLHEVKQRSQARDALRWQLQQLLDVRINDKRHQEQVQMIRQLENNIEKMHMKIHAGQKVTTLYLALRDVLKKELDYLLLHLELLYTMVGAYHGEVQDRELMASGALRASDITKKDLAMLETRFLAEEEDRHRILSARKVQTDWLWLKEASKKHSRAQARYDLAVDFPSLLMQDSALGSQLQATRSQIEHESFVTAEVEKAKAAVQCSRVWDITSRLLAQQKSTAELEQHIRACKEKRRALKDTLQELELKHAKLKFHQPPSAISCRKLEAELRVRLQQEEARLEQARAQYVRNQELLLQFENGLDNLIVRLHGINVPEQDLTVEFKGVDEKLQHCRQKLQHLAQRVSSLPAHSYSPDEDNEVLGCSVLALVFGGPHLWLCGTTQGVLPAGRMEVTLGKGWDSAGHCGVSSSQGTSRWDTPHVLTPAFPLAINSKSFTDFCEGQEFNGENDCGRAMEPEDSLGGHRLRGASSL
ncbi:coiled-coil domain-containing protein 183 isoform X1 [Tympanuchus pallidicinctus]|uniref:coiled-coil domain-containing protein 183 isoform X1 n=1 Tax=Tympanuchus pallidicinctus TaxID=109042 RepID=UPI002286EFF9|nr:coiled-coil domain-containing protein 183 isoform X1 [Tympanuchus pallidicinctus]